MQRTAKRFKKSEWRDIMPKQSTTEEFVYKAKKIHGDKYDYSKSVYTRSCDKVIIICKEHGEFLQTASEHLQGSGCVVCRNEKNTKPVAVFLSEANNIHKNKYDYHKMKYHSSTEKIIIVCKIHGEFNQTPTEHIQGYGCPKCGGSFPLTTEEFIEKAKKVHGDKYDYSKTVYTRTKDKVIIICKEHGEFFQTPNAHVSAKKGCHRCGKNFPSTVEELVTRFRKKHGDKYEYPKSKLKYINQTVKIKIVCPIHGIFLQSPLNHISGKGCIKCGKIRTGEVSRNSVEDFIKKSKHIHGDKYDYSNCDYISNNKKVCIICPKHGKYYQLPTNHISGKGCKKCSACISNKETKFLENIKIPVEQRQIRIQNYFVDGYMQDQKIIYEFLGDFWHGNPKIYSRGEMNSVTKTTFGHLYDKTFKKFKTLHDLGYTVKYIWEDEWDDWNKDNSTPLEIHEYKNH
jgi:hypothetical protein